MEKKTIAILGATESMGSMLARNLASAKYRLLLFSHEVHELKALVKEIKKALPAADLDSHKCLVDASWEADIIVFAVSLTEEKILAKTIQQVATQKIVILPSDFSGKTDKDASFQINAAGALQHLLPHSKLVEVYFSVNSEPTNRGDGKHIHVLITGDDAEAVETVREIFLETGFSLTISIGESSTA
jgi:predicted dinucleotide-binding enzyme